MGEHIGKCKVKWGRETFSGTTKVQQEVGGLDEFGPLCIVPDDLTEEVLNTVMRSQLLKKSYQIREVVGKTVGRVPYFLNKTFAEEIESGTVETIEG